MFLVLLMFLFILFKLNFYISIFFDVIFFVASVHELRVIQPLVEAFVALN